MNRKVGVLVALVGVVLIAGAVGAGSNAPNDAVTIADFEDNTTTVDKPGWSGFDDPNNVLTTTDSALNGSHSGLYRGDLSTGWQPANVTRSSYSTQNASFTIAVAGEDGDQARHNISFYNDSSGGAVELLSIDWVENSSDFDPGDINVTGSSTTQIGTWDERNTQIQTVTVDFDFGSDEATVYLNGTAQATVTLAAFSTTSQDGWDRMAINSEIGSPTAADSQIRIDNVGAQFTNRAPIVDNASASPTGELDKPQQTLSIDVNDSTFSDEPIEELTVDWYKDGLNFAFDTVTSNGTVTQDTTFTEGGDQEWSAVVKDSHGGVTDSQTFSVKVPSNLTIYNESAPEEIVNKSTEVEISFFAEDEVITRNSTDGTVNMSGLPADEPFIARVTADGWYSRTKIIPSLFEDQRLYLANRSVVTANEVRFTLDDQSGDFPRDESELYIEKPLTRNGSTTFEVIHSDEFGATGVTVDLENDTRYRLIIENGQGDRRNVGPYTSSASEVVELTPGVAGISLDPEPGTYDWAAEFDNDTGTHGSVVFDYADPEDETDELRVKIYEQGNESNEFVNTTEPGPLGNATITYMLQNQDERNLTFAVEFEADRNETQTGKAFVSAQPDEILPGLSGWIQQALAFGVLILLGASFTVADRQVGAVVLPIFAGFFWYMQWLQGLTSGAAIVLALAIAGGVQISRRAG